ncbi:MAG: chorismate mutase, partial [Ruminiclostridium sp.]|nr:chorismate mutase [Ruminiclostridium sp.]
MNLDEIRKEIDITDSKLLELFARRMELCRNVAQYKKENGMPVFQGSREKQVLDKISAQSPNELEGASRLLFSQIMEISKCLQQEQLTEYKETEFSQLKKDPKNTTVACPGIRGSYSEEACIKAFGENSHIDYYDTFDKVFEAVNSGKADYGVLPIENSTAGSVEGTYKLLERYEMHLCGRLSIPVNHVLAAKSKDIPIEKVISHEQALHQCS